MENTLCEKVPLFGDPICAICMCSLENKSQIKECHHLFCFSCIWKWSETKRSCPLCKSEFSTLYYNFQPDGSFDQKNVPLPTRTLQENDLRGDLEALDSSYFLAETVRFKKMAENTQREINKLKNTRSFGSFEQNSLEELDKIFVRLEEFIVLFGSDERFEPLSVLNSLYSLQDSLHVIQAGPQQVSEQLASKPIRYSAEDFDNIPEEDEEECEEEEYFDNSRAMKRYQPTPFLRTNKNTKSKKST